MGANGFWYFGFGVALKLPIVRPWKLFWKLTISCFSPEGSRVLPTLRQNLMAASLASLPELQMNAFVACDIAPEALVWVTRS